MKRCDSSGKHSFKDAFCRKVLAIFLDRGCWFYIIASNWKFCKYFFPLLAPEIFLFAIRKLILQFGRTKKFGGFNEETSRKISFPWKFFYSKLQINSRKKCFLTNQHLFPKKSQSSEKQSPKEHIIKIIWTAIQQPLKTQDQDHHIQDSMITI